jgi:signal transduction histidine kinase
VVLRRTEARDAAPRDAALRDAAPRDAALRDAAPLIPPGLGDEELGAGGPWAVLAPDGTILAISAGNYQSGPDGAPSLFPVLTSVTSAATGSVIETVVIGRANYRILTMPLHDPVKAGGLVIGYVQVASRLDVRDAQRQNLIGSLALVALLALGGALVVALLITRRALAPIAAAAARERAMVASASHELRTPAAVILSSAEILEREKLVKPGGMELVRGIVAESERLGRLSADLLTISIQSPSKEASASVAEAVTDVELRPIDLADVARSAVERATPMAQRSGAGLQQQIGSERLPINGDAGRLMQLLLGLVENALRHSPAGGSVTIGTALDGDHVSAWVDDEGAGIAVADRERIFEPFYRGAGTTRTDGGAGLGLAIARQIVTAHTGAITAETAPSGGARLLVRLPLRQASFDTSPAPSDSKPRRSKGRA